MAPKQLPNLPDQERAVLASCLVEGNSWWSTVERMAGDDSLDVFWEADHRIVAAAMKRLADAGSRISISSLTDSLLGDQAAEEILAPDIRTYLTQLQFRSSLRSVTELQSTTSELIDVHGVRMAIKNLESVTAEAYSGDVRPAELSGRLREMSGSTGGLAELRRLGEVVEEMEAEDAMGVPFRVPTGIGALDKVIKGYEPGRLYVIGARPKVGKSTLILNSALEALASDAVVLLASLEMNRRELWSKLLSAQAYVEQTKIQEMLDGDLKRSDFPPDQQGLLKEAERELKQADLYLMEASDVRNGVDSVIAAALSLKSQYPEGTPIVVFIDYLQLLVKDNFNKVAEMSDITRKLKLTAQDLGIPFILPSQINRAGAEEGMPGPHQLRDSGSIEQDADVIILLNRPALQDDSQPAHIMDIWVALTRYTQPGWVKAFYAPEYQTIQDNDGWDDDNRPESGPERGAKKPKEAATPADGGSERVEDTSGDRRERRSQRRSRRATRPVDDEDEEY